MLFIGLSFHVALLASSLALVFLLWLAWSETRSSPTFAILLRLAVCTLLIVPPFVVLLGLFLTRLNPPEGRLLTRQESPKLFAALDKLRHRFKGPRFDKVLLDDAFTATMAQLPRHGLFGRRTNYLVLGLPHMLGLPPREMLAAVAREYSQLGSQGSKQKDQLGAWVCRQRLMLGLLHAQLREDRESSPFNAVLAAVLDRFMPRYNAYTFVLARRREGEADRAAGKMLTPVVCANGLVREALLGRWVNGEFWPKLYRQADRAQRPRFMPFKAMGTAFKAAHGEWAAPEQLAAALLQRDDYEDTHAVLFERLEASGQPAAAPPVTETMAAEALLGSTTTRMLIDEFDNDWWQRERPPWEQRYQYATRSRQRLAELAAVGMEELPLAELQQMALLTAEFESPQLAKPIFKHVLKQAGGPFPNIEFVLGRILLEEDNRRGLEHLAAAAAHDPALIPAAVEMGYDYLVAADGEQAAESWSAKMLPHQDDD